MTAHHCLSLRGQARHMAEVGLEGWARLGFLFREGKRAGGKVMGKTTENDTRKHTEPAEQAACGRTHRLSTTVPSHVTCHGVVQLLLTLQKRE